MSIGNSQEKPVILETVLATGGGGATTWAAISGKPTEFTPSAHSHTAAQVTEDSTHRFATDAEKATWNAKQASLGFTAENVANKAIDLDVVNDTKYPSLQLMVTQLLLKAAASHSHTAANITDFNVAALAAAPAETTATIKTALGITTLSGSNTGDQTNISGNAATVTTNANLTGPVTSVGNATSIANGTISNAMLANGAVANLSGTNTGDNAVNSLYSGLAASKEDTANKQTDLTASATKFPTVNAVNTGLALKANLISPSFTTPALGVATGTSLAVTGALTSSGVGIGYATGAGGTVTQLTSRSTTVVLSKLCGNITMFSAAQASQALVTFTLTNTFIAATDILIVKHISATNGGAWNFSTVCGSGSATISIRNVTAASITEATPLRFILIKGVTA